MSLGSYDFDQLSRDLARQPSRRDLLLLLVIAALLPSFLIWAALTELDNITRGEGRLIAAEQNQVVQAGEAGVLLRRHVEENSVVSRGVLLFELDPVDAESELNRLLQRQRGAMIREARLRAELGGWEFHVPASLAAEAPQIAASEAALLEARRAELIGALRVLEEQLLQRQQALAGARSAQAAASRRRALIEAGLTSLAPLRADNLAPAQRILDLELSLEDARAAEAAALNTAAQTEAAIRQVEEEQTNRRQSQTLRAQEELAAVLTDLAEVDQTLPLLRERVSRTQIRSPVDGIVSRLSVRTTGGYVSSGAALLEIVPTGEDLVVEAKLAPRDISAVAIGDAARVRFDAYDAARHGHADGVVSRISADALPDPSNPSMRHYTIEVALNGALPDDGAGGTARLLPGMSATVDVVSGKRSVLDYIWRPVARVQELALRD
jgi:membrane fusion protein, adhesin transport system